MVSPMSTAFLGLMMGGLWASSSFSSVSVLTDFSAAFGIVIYSTDSNATKHSLSFKAYTQPKITLDMGDIIN